MSFPLCRHIRTNGRRCRAASITDSPWCFFHKNLHTAHKPFRHTEATRGYLLRGQHIQLAPVEDRESVQLALSIVINALAVGQLDTKRATVLLYGLQVASANARQLDPPPADRTIRDIFEEPDGTVLADLDPRDPA